MRTERVEFFVPTVTSRARFSDEKTRRAKSIPPPIQRSAATDSKACRQRFKGVPPPIQSHRAASFRRAAVCVAARVSLRATPRASPPQLPSLFSCSRLPGFEVEERVTSASVATFSSAAIVPTRKFVSI